jgi:2-polyprenyl-6-methoxyphenol hydroxylase-like FAD-dependent oxidoreductase
MAAAQHGSESDIIIIGAGIGGLTLGLALHQAGIRCRIYESAPEIRAVGVGVNLLPHATKVLAGLGLEDPLRRVAITTAESVFFNRFGQLIYREPLGRFAGYPHPQFSIHRGDLQAVLLDAFVARAGSDRLFKGWHAVAVDQDSHGAVVRFRDADGERTTQRGSAVVACDGIHSAIRRQFYPQEGPPRYSGVNMWRGVTRWKPILTGASMIRAGWLATGKMVVYPIRDRIDADGRQLVNWVAELETPHYLSRDWNRRGHIGDFIGAFEDWHFDWLDVPEFIRAADTVLEFPMVDQDPLPRWSFDRVTLLGDAAHPMLPRGSNGAGQAIIDAAVLTDCVRRHTDAVAALKEYEDQRLAATAKVVRTNRENPPDAILREVYLRTGDKPFTDIGAVIRPEELAAMSDGYKAITGQQREARL